MASKASYGASVHVSVDGNGGGESVDAHCYLSDCEQYKCPFGMFEISPPEKGMRCALRDDGWSCNSLAARVASLKRAAKVVNEVIKRAASEMEG